MAIAVRELGPVEPGSAAARQLEFEEFYRTHARRVRGLVRRRIADRDLAAEVVQDTFLRAHANFERLDPSRPAWPWLARVASNLCVDALRRRSADASLCSRQERPSGAPSEEVLDWASDPAEVFERAVHSQAVADALAAVPSRQRHVLVLKDGEGWTAEQIARLDGASTEGVKSLLRRARTAFRDSYERIAEERGVRAGFAVLGAPPARLGARASQAVGAASGRS